MENINNFKSEDKLVQAGAKLCQAQTSLSKLTNKIVATKLGNKLSCIVGGMRGGG